MKLNSYGVFVLFLALFVLPVAVESSAEEGPFVLVLRFDDIDEIYLPVAETLISWAESEFSGHEGISVEYLDMCIPLNDQCINSAVSAGQDAGSDIVFFGSYLDKGEKVHIALLGVVATDGLGMNRAELSFLFEDECGLDISEITPGSPVPRQFGFFANIVVADWMLTQNRLDDASLFFESSLQYADAVPLDYLYVIYCIKAETDAQLGKYMPAIDAFTEAIRLDPTYVNNYCLRAACFDAIDSLDNAVDDLMIAIEMDPEDAQINAQLGAQLTQAGRLEEAQYYLDRSIELDPFCAMTFRDRARSFLLMKQYESALMYIDIAVRLESDHAQGHAMRAIVLYFSGRNEESIDAYTIAIGLERDPEVLAWGYYGRASCYIDQDNYQAALDDLLTAQEYSGSSYTVLYLIGVCYMHLGNHDLAEAYFTEYLQYPLELTPVDPWTTPDLHERAQELLDELQQM